MRRRGGPYDGTYIFKESDGDSWNVEIRDDATDITAVYVSGASTLSYVGTKMNVSKKIDENTYEIKSHSNLCVEFSDYGSNGY